MHIMLNSRDTVSERNFTKMLELSSQTVELHLNAELKQLWTT